MTIRRLSTRALAAYVQHRGLKGARSAWPPSTLSSTHRPRPDNLEADLSVDHPQARPAYPLAWASRHRGTGSCSQRRFPTAPHPATTHRQADENGGWRAYGLGGQIPQRRLNSWHLLRHKAARKLDMSPTRRIVVAEHQTCELRKAMYDVGACNAATPRALESPWRACVAD